MKFLSSMLLSSPYIFLLDLKDNLLFFFIVFAVILITHLLMNNKSKTLFICCYIISSGLIICFGNINAFLGFIFLLAGTVLLGFNQFLLCCLTKKKEISQFKNKTLSIIFFVFGILLYFFGVYIIYSAKL